MSYNDYKPYHNQSKKTQKKHRHKKVTSHTQLRQIKHPFQHETINMMQVKPKKKVQDKHTGSSDTRGCFYETISCNRFTHFLCTFLLGPLGLYKWCFTSYIKTALRCIWLNLWCWHNRERWTCCESTLHNQKRQHLVFNITRSIFSLDRSSTDQPFQVHIQTNISDRVHQSLTSCQRLLWHNSVPITTVQPRTSVICNLWGRWWAIS